MGDCAVHEAEVTDAASTTSRLLGGLGRFAKRYAEFFEPGFVVLPIPMRIRGVLALDLAQPRWLLIPEQVQQLDTLARQIAIALERVHYVEIAQQAVVEMESERLRNALLAAISHGTPLTAVIGLSESLQQSRPALGAHQAETARALTEQARELSALVSNLLDMARLQSGAVNLRMQWQSVEEVVGSAIRQAEHALGSKSVQTELPADLPLVEFDAVLIERVLVNILENAAKYGAAPIVVRAAVTPGNLVIAVLDHGPGLPASVKGHEQSLFDKFTRGEVEFATPGVGLGLAICKAVVDARRGQISAANAPDGGAQFTRPNHSGLGNCLPVSVPTSAGRAKPPPPGRGRAARTTRFALAMLRSTVSPDWCGVMVQKFI